MAFTPAKPVATKAKLDALAPKISVRWQDIPRGLGSVSISFHKDTAERLFGKTYMGARYNIEIGRGDDQGLVRIAPAEDGAFTPRSMAHRSFRLVVKPWDLCPKEDQATDACEIVSEIGEVVLKLPSWAHQKDPSLAKEFALKT